MAAADRDLELVALARLGLASRVDDSVEPSGSLVDALVAKGTLRPHQAAAVRAYVERHAITCGCGARSLAPEEGTNFGCTACGRMLSRTGTGGKWNLSSKKVSLPAVGDRIGPLELLEVLGRGANGIVYRARHVELGRESALKLLPLAAEDERKRKRFEREVEALARLRHPGIVKVHSALEHQGSLCCEMEFVRGHTLEHVIEKGPVPWREAARIVARIAEAVDHAHRAGVVHRDLKPANVLVREADGQPLVADFGLARLSDQESSLTRMGAFVGTPVYMAPEAFGGKTGPAADIYGLGAILYELLAGKPPFEEANPFTLLAKVTKGLVEPLRVPGMPHDLERVRARAMAPDPMARHATPLALARDLEKVLAGEPLAWVTPVRTNATALLVLAGAGALLVGGAVVAIRSRRGPALPGVPEATAIERLDRALAGGSESERTQAVAAIRDDARAIAAIDSAVGRRPDDAGLRRLRARLVERTGGAVDAADLLVLDGPDLEAAVQHALARGVRPGALGPLRAAHAKHPDSRGVTALLGIALCASGDPGLHDEAAQALVASRSTDPRAQRLARAIVAADAIAEAVGRGKHDAAFTAASERLVADLRGIARDDPRGVAVVLARLVGTIRDGLRHRMLGGLDRADPYPDVINVLSCVRPHLSADARAVLAIIIDLAPDGNYPEDSGDDLAAIASEVAPREPLVSASLYELAAARTQAGELAAKRFLLSEDTLARARPETDFEKFWVATIEHRNASGRSELDARLADAATSPEVARAHLEQALTLRRHALELSRRDTGTLRALERDAANVVRLLFRLGRESESEPYLLLVRQEKAWRAELLRRAGKPAEALEMARAATKVATKEWAADAWAVLALSLADLGRFDEARKALDELIEAEKIEGALLDHLHPAQVSEELLGRSRR